MYAIRSYYGLPSSRSFNQGNPSDNIIDQPTINVNKSDIRHSLKDEDFLFTDEFFDTSAAPDVTKIINESESILEEGMKALKHTNVDEKRVRSIARKILNDYKSEYKKADFEENMIKVFAYMQTADRVDYKDMIRLMSEIATSYNFV